MNIMGMKKHFMHILRLQPNLMETGSEIVLGEKSHQAQLIKQLLRSGGGNQSFTVKAFNAW